jgi:hypothetical protein
MRGKITRPSEQTEKQKEQIEDARAYRRAIRNGIKTDRDTQPVQVRMLVSQLAVLKQISNLEGRTTSDIIRFLVDGYIDYCIHHWPEGDALDILMGAVRLSGYEPPEFSQADADVFGIEYGFDADYDEDEHSE